MEEFKMKKFTFISMIICALALGFSFVNAQSKTASLNDEVVTDIDGNTYTTVTIGTQIWMVENLITTRYRNGDEIGTTSTPDMVITDEATPKYQWCWRNVDTNIPTYRRYYTWFAATDPRNIAPVGYRVPTDQDFIDLANYLIENGDRFSFDGLKNSGTVDANNKIVKALASTSSTWQTTATVGSPGNDKAANNASGFSFLPTGYRTVAASPWSFGNQGAYSWTSNESLTTPANGIARWMFYNSTSFNTRPNGENKKYGMPVRCIKGESPSSVGYVKDGILKFQIYPSQVKDNATIIFPTTLTEKVSLDIYTIEGKLVYQNDYLSIGGLDKISVQLSHLNTGIYLCKVNSANVSNVVKFTKK